MDNKRISINYAVTRGQKRYIAKRVLKEKGEKQFCKHSYTDMQTSNFTYYNRVPSFFAEHWREYTEVSA